MSSGLPPLPGTGRFKSSTPPDMTENNPFRLPGDDHVFRMREEEVCLLAFKIISTVLRICSLLKLAKNERNGEN